MKILYVLILSIVIIHSSFGQYHKKSVSEFEITAYSEIKHSDLEIIWKSYNAKFVVSSEELIFLENDKVISKYKVIDIDVSTRPDYIGLLFGAYCRDDVGEFIYISIGLTTSGDYSILFERDNKDFSVAFLAIAR